MLTRSRRGTSASFLANQAAAARAPTAAAAVSSAAPTPSSPSSPTPPPSQPRPPRARHPPNGRPHPTTGAATSPATTHRRGHGRAAQGRAGAAIVIGGTGRHIDGTGRRCGSASANGKSRRPRRGGGSRRKRRRKRTRACSCPACSLGLSAPCLLRAASTVRHPFHGPVPVCPLLAVVLVLIVLVGLQVLCSVPTTLCSTSEMPSSRRQTLLVSHVRLHPLLAAVRYLLPPLIT